MRLIGERIGSAPAADEWALQPAALDESVLALSDEIRRIGIRTAVLTNGTDTIPAEIATHGIADRFDAIFNSAEIGYTKPDVRAFQHVLETLDVEPADVFFTDDSSSKLVGAASLSMRTHLFTGVGGLRDRLIAEGVEGLIEDSRR